MDTTAILYNIANGLFRALATIASRDACSIISFHFNHSGANHIFPVDGKPVGILASIMKCSAPPKTAGPNQGEGGREGW